MLRNIFNKASATKGGSALRNLADKICSYCQTSVPAGKGFFPPLLNFLANGDASPSYIPPAAILSPSDVIQWKDCTVPRLGGPLLPGAQEESYGGSGSSHSACRGLSLLFDPLVDAFLYANLDSQGNLGLITAVHVLLDYGAFYDVLICNRGGVDWGNTETARILGGSVDDLTTKRLLTSVCGCTPNHWKTNPAPILGKMKGVLVWNFIPFLRDGPSSSGTLPISLVQNSAWPQVCWDWLREFLQAVAAQHLIIGCGVTIAPATGSTSTWSSIKGTVTTANLPKSLIPQVTSPTLPHCVNGKQVFIAPHFANRILGKDSETFVSGVLNDLRTSDKSSQFNE